MFFNCTNLIKMSIIHKKKGFIIVNNKNNIDLLKCFIKIKIIKFIKIKETKIFVYINYLNNKPIFKNVTNLFKQSHKKYIRLNDIKKISSNKNWILIISTNKGILNNFEALKNNIGGLLIAKISN